LAHDHHSYSIELVQYGSSKKHGDAVFVFLKGHGNEADFLGFLLKLVPHRFPTLPFEPLRFRLRILGDIRNRKTTPRLGKSAFECLKENSASRRVDDSVSAIQIL
jgi:hypothetical protein